MTTRLLRAGPLALCLTILHPVPAEVAAQAPAPAAPPASTPAPAMPVLTAEQWREDLRFMVGELERRHRNLYHHMSREAFQAAVADLNARIPSLQRNQIIVEMMRIAAMVGDGHTRVDPRKDAAFRFPSFPLKLYLFDDGLHVRAARQDYAQLVGAKVEAIGGVPVAEAIRRVEALAPGERGNPMGPIAYVSLYLAMPDILQAVGLSDRRDRARLTLSRDGRRWTVEVPAGQVDPLWPPDTDVTLVTPEGWVDAQPATLPTWLQAPLQYHRLIDMPERQALYVQINMIANIEGQSLGQFGTRIRERVQATNPRSVIIDLRLAHGGNGSLRNLFIREMIRTEDRDTRLFVLTGRGTFSASQFLLDDFDRLTDAIFIGEPAGSSPTSYGDAYRSAMPNSGITIRASIVYWQHGQNFDPWTWVDIAAPLTFADYVAGRDPALEAALGFTAPPPFSRTVADARRAGGRDAVRAALDAFVREPARRYANLPFILVRTAEVLNGSGEPAAALDVAEFAMERYPGEADAALVFAIFAANAGRMDDARRGAEQLLRIDPNNRQIRSVVERLGAAPRPPSGP